MLIGPVFTREVTISPRRARTFVGRSVYGVFFLLLTATAWLVMTGTQLIVDTGDFSRFGTALFRLLTPLQLMITLFFAAVLAAAGAAQEKDRKTLLLLLLTRMSNSELVLGKLLASLLEILTFTVISIPIMMTISLLGGISYPQIVRSFLVILFGALAAGSVGSTVALWREKTFQAISMTVLILVLWLGIWGMVGLGIFGKTLFGVSASSIAASASPWNAVFLAMNPDEGGHLLSLTLILRPIFGYLVFYAGLTFMVNAAAVAMVRVWNPSRELRQRTPEEDTWRRDAVSERQKREIAERVTERIGVDGPAASLNPYDNLTDNLFAVEAEHPDRAALSAKNVGQSAVAPAQTAPDSPSSAISVPANEMMDAETHAALAAKVKVNPALSAAGGKVRPVWDNPIIWREIRTHAYGRRNLIIRVVYFLLFAMSAFVLHGTFAHHHVPTLAQAAGPLVPLFILSFILVNAQAVTSLTSERDGGTFVLLLVSDISPKEFVYGKLGGTFYNMREIILFPLLLCGYLWFLGGLNATNAFFLFTGLAVLYFFAAMIGVHIGMQYLNTRSALATSLGIIFFLFVGIGTCIWIMLAFSGSFESQLQPFLAFMLGGGVGLYLCLGIRNPSSAIALASFILPPATFYAITCLLLGQFHWVFFSVVGAYLFTTIAMLIPAIDEFDVATGRTTAD